MLDLQYSSANLDWDKLGFSYTKTPFRFHAYYADGEWNAGQLVESNTVTISEGSTCLNYGQQVFEGIKAYMTRSGKVTIFRPELNLARINASAERLLMQPLPEDLFMRGITDTIKANAPYIPPYGSGASFYLRPVILGIGDNLGLRPADQFLFMVYGTPVGPYFTSGLASIKLLVTDIDRAPAKGIGHVKTGANYAGALMGKTQAMDQGYDEALYLDSATRSYIDETGATNVFGIKDDRFITPDSKSILESITRISLMDLAPTLGLTVEHRPIRIEELAEFDEFACCGTAAAVCPVAEVKTPDAVYKFSDEPGPKSVALLNEITAIQYDHDGANKDFAKWRYHIEG